MHDKKNMQSHKCKESKKQKKHEKDGIYHKLDKRISHYVCMQVLTQHGKKLKETTKQNALNETKQNEKKRSKKGRKNWNSTTKQTQS